MENINQQTEENFIDDEEYNKLFCNNDFGPKVIFKEYKFSFNKSVDSLEDLEFDSILNSVEVISSEDNESQNNSLEEQKEVSVITHKIKKVETIDSMAEKKSVFGCFDNKMRRRLKTFDSNYSTNVNNTKRSHNFSKSIKLNDSLTKFRKKKGQENPSVRCRCNIF
jgi:hypothetical protein